MKYNKFIKTTYKTQFIKTDYGDIVDKNHILEEIEELIMRFLADRCTEEETRDFVERTIAKYEVYDDKLIAKTKALMKKWSLEL